MSQLWKSEKYNFQFFKLKMALILNFKLKVIYNFKSLSIVCSSKINTCTFKKGYIYFLKLEVWNF